MLSLKYFDLYTANGMKIIPVYPNSKVPVGKNWNETWDREKCRSLIETGEYNLGVLLGDLVDVEGDTPEANDSLNAMIGGLAHPMYRSSRSVHHLFVNPDPSLTATRFLDVEFRGHRHQSVLPPSTHGDGTEYLWLRGTSLHVPSMPQALLDFYFENRREVQTAPKLLPNGLTKTICKNCGAVEIIHKKRLMLEVRAFAEHGLLWMCHSCRELDIREACRRIRKTL